PRRKGPSTSPRSSGAPGAQTRSFPPAVPPPPEPPRAAGTPTCPPRTVVRVGRGENRPATNETPERTGTAKKKRPWKKTTPQLTAPRQTHKRPATPVHAAPPPDARPPRHHSDPRFPADPAPPARHRGRTWSRRPTPTPAAPRPAP